MTPAHESPIRTEHIQQAIASFLQDSALVETHGTLLAYLIDRDRPDEARLLLDEPGQASHHALQRAFYKLSHPRADAWSQQLFEDVVARGAPLYPRPGEPALRYGFHTFVQGREPRAIDAARTLVRAHGARGKLARGETLLHEAARSAIAGVIDLLLEAGASISERNDLGQTPFDLLLEEPHRERLTPAALTSLATSPFPPVPALARFLADPVATRPLAEVTAVLETLIALGAPAGPFDDEKSPAEAVLRSARPPRERAALLDLLERSGKLGGTLAAALPGVVEDFHVERLEDALARAGAHPNDPHGPHRRTLLHHACASLCDFSDAPDAADLDDFVGQRVLPTITFLLKFGESLQAKDRRGKTPLDLARAQKSQLEAPSWKRILPLLSPASPTRPTAKKPATKATPAKASAKQPAAKASAAKQPAAKAAKPAAKKPAAKASAPRPAAKKPAAKKPAAKASATKQPALKKPALKKPALKKPAAKKPALRKPAAKKPAAKRPAAKKPAAKRPAKKAR